MTATIGHAGAVERRIFSLRRKVTVSESDRFLAVDNSAVDQRDDNWPHHKPERVA